jgi:N-methylhydantoinase A/oxoprolinase/acetone carboxylase beta subunit
VAGLDPTLVRDALDGIERTVAETVDRMKTSAGDIPVVVVGGGSVLLRDALPGASELVKPDHFAVANAIGAAIAQVGGEVDRVAAMEGRARQDVLDEARAEAVEKAVAAGARRGSVEIVEVEEIPLAYVPGNAVRVRVKAVGDLELEGAGATR